MAKMLMDDNKYIGALECIRLSSYLTETPYEKRNAGDILKQVCKDKELKVELGRRARASGVILGILSNGGVTHPNIARRIQKELCLTDEQYYQMIPINHRPGPSYDPDKFVHPIDIDIAKSVYNYGGYRVYD